MTPTEFNNLKNLKAGQDNGYDKFIEEVNLLAKKYGTDKYQIIRDYLSMLG